jgi:hypothetical protein
MAKKSHPEVECSPEVGGRISASARQDLSESKRLAARRRFLLGGAALVPAIVTIGQREAHAASMLQCLSIDPSALPKEEWTGEADSYYCKAEGDPGFKIE